MTPKDFEQPIGLDLPWISPKTESRQLAIWSKEFWPSDARKRVATDIVNNGKELLAGSNINWELVMKSIRVQRPGARHLGEAAIAANDAITIGGLGAVANWPMDHPAIVYLSGKCIVDRAENGGELEDFKSRIRQATISYGQKALDPYTDYMNTLDFLLGVKDRSKHRKTINRLQVLLRDGDIETAYRVVKSRGALVRMRGYEPSSTTTSSILTPPNPGM